MVLVVKVSFWGSIESIKILKGSSKQPIAEIALSFGMHLQLINVNLQIGKSPRVYIIYILHIPKHLHSVVSM